MPMIVLIQRVTGASVSVGGKEIAAIGPGLLAMVGIENADGEAETRRMAEKLIAYRVFPDRGGRMNLGVADAGGEVLLVPQFTLAADTQKGLRPGFSSAAEPADARRLFDRLVASVRERHDKVASGEFGAKMLVSLVNDGPVTFWLRVAPADGETRN